MATRIRRGSAAWNKRQVANKRRAQKRVTARNRTKAKAAAAKPVARARGSRLKRFAQKTAVVGTVIFAGHLAVGCGNGTVGEKVGRAIDKTGSGLKSAWDWTSHAGKDAWGWTKTAASNVADGSVAVGSTLKRVGEETWLFVSGKPLLRLPEEIAENPADGKRNVALAHKEGTPFVYIYSKKHGAWYKVPVDMTNPAVRQALEQAVDEAKNVDQKIEEEQRKKEDQKESSRLNMRGRESSYTARAARARNAMAGRGAKRGGYA